MTSNSPLTIYTDRSVASNKSKAISLPVAEKGYNISPRSYKRSKSTLVFLKDDDDDVIKPRLMQQKLQTNSTEWFQDKRYHHQQQAEYLKKLTDMRNGLQVNRMNNKSKQTNHNSDQNSTGFPRLMKQNGALTGPERYTDRQRKLQNERMNKLERQQRKQANNLGELDVRPLTDTVTTISSTEGSPVLYRRPYDSAKELPTSLQLKLPYLTSPSDGYINIKDGYINTKQSTNHFDSFTNFLEKQSFVNQSPPLGQGGGGRVDNLLPVQYTSSIPNIGRRAVRHPGKLMLEDSKGNTFYRNDHNKGKTKYRRRKQYMRADADEIDLTADSFIQDERYTDFYRKYDYNSVAPCSTPAENTWVHDGLPQENPDQQDRHDLISQFQRHRTHTQDLIEVKQSQQTEMNNNNHHGNHNGRCIFCENPELIPQVLPNSEVTTFPNYALAMSEVKPKVKRSLKREKRTEILVNLPQVSYAPELTVESPKSSKSLKSSNAFNESPRETGVLYKTYRQNELRQREVSNLLEDVHEINQLNKTIQDISGLEDPE